MNTWVLNADRVNCATVRQLQIESIPLPEGQTGYDRVIQRDFGWELVRCLVTPLILKRMENPRY
jgi:hypothetical protein